MCDSTDIYSWRLDILFREHFYDYRVDFRSYWFFYCSMVSICYTHLTYLFFYLFTKKHFQCDEDNIVLSNRRGSKKISKDQIKSITYSRVSIFLVALAYEDYGSVTIRCNEKGNYEILRFKVFPRVIRRLRTMGYPVK